MPPSPREKASAQRPTIFSYGNARHFRLYRIILDPVGANPRVRPTILSCPTVFIKKTAASYPWAHTSVRPYVVKEAWRCFSHIWRIGHACFAQKRFSVQKPSPEEKVARHLSSMVICMVTLCNRSSVKSTRRRQIFNKLCGAVTEEGKRTCPFADRPIQETLRLPSSVTLPPTFDESKTSSVSNLFQ